MNLSILQTCSPPTKKELPSFLAKSNGENILEHSLNAGVWGETLYTYLRNNQPKIAEQLPELGLPAGLHDIGKISETFEKVLAGETNFEFYHEHLSEAWCRKIGISSTICTAIGAHHTRLKDLLIGTNLESAQAYLKSYEEVREKLYKTLYGRFGKCPTFNGSPWLLGGTIILCDWLASGGIKAKESILEPLFCPVHATQGLGFEEIFGFSPNELQKKAWDLNANLTLICASMGKGKTEAALAMVYKSLSRRDTTGLYFALPTRLTSNMIHLRVQSFLKRLEIPNRPKLIHSTAWLSEQSNATELNQLLQETEEGTEDMDTKVQLPDWLMGSKGALLARMGIGTIDQILMTVLRTKHFPLRYLGLCNKSIVIDEVHSYDMYTGTLLAELLRELLAMSCKVILLSATLTSELKSELLSIDTSSALLEDPDPINQSVEIAIKPSAKCREMAIKEANNGNIVLWVANTVKNAQDAYEHFRNKTTEIEIGLLHSRFTQTDRTRNESYWMQRLGKHGKREGCILVATQVVEQSVDIDADILFTELCPIDYLFQRIGRLHRHNFPRNVPRSATIIEPEDKGFGNLKFIYSQWILHKTLTELRHRKIIVIPSEMQMLLDNVYMEKNYNAVDLKDPRYLEYSKLRKDLQEAAKAQLNRYLVSSQSDDEMLAKTRLFDQAQVQVLIIRRVSCGHLTLFDGSIVDTNKAYLSVEDKRNILNNCVTTRHYLGMKVTNNSALAKMNIYEGILGESGDLTIDGDSRQHTYDDRGLYTPQQKHNE